MTVNYQLEFLSVFLPVYNYHLHVSVESKLISEVTLSYPQMYQREVDVDMLNAVLKSMLADVSSNSLSSEQLKAMH